MSDSSSALIKLTAPDRLRVGSDREEKGEDKQQRHGIALGDETFFLSDFWGICNSEVLSKVPD